MKSLKCVGWISLPGDILNELTSLRPTASQCKTRPARQCRRRNVPRSVRTSIGVRSVPNTLPTLHLHQNKLDSRPDQTFIKSHHVTLQCNKFPGVINGSGGSPGFT